MTPPTHDARKRIGHSMQRALQAAWEVGVARDYDCGLFGTERGLQASLYFHLRALLGPGERVFVEPRIILPERAIIPDICIVGEHEVWVLELKLQNAARQGVVWESDFQKFAAFTNPSGMTLKLEGRGDFEETLLHDNMYFLFAAVGDSSCGALSLKWLREKTTANPKLKDVLQRIYWAGGITDLRHFEGPVSLLSRERREPE